MLTLIGAAYHHEKRMMIVSESIDPAKFDNFLEYITSSHIVKDQPFGQKKIRTPEGKMIETLNGDDTTSNF